MDKQRDDHSRQLRKISSYASEKMTAFKREERLNALNKFALPSPKTSRLLAVHSLGPSRVAAFPEAHHQDAHAGNTSGSSDQDSESSGSQHAQGRTLDELIASGRTIDPTTGSIRKRFSVLFNKANPYRQGSEGAATAPGDENGPSSSDSSAEENLESNAFLDVPVSGTRSLRVKAARKVASVSDAFAPADGGSGSAGTSSAAEAAKAPDLRELLEGFHPRNASFGVKELKVKKGAESLLNLVRLSRQHHTSIDQSEIVNSSVELLVGNRCAASATRPDSVAWTVFVEELHATVGCIERVCFGPLPPLGEVVAVSGPPFAVTRESPVLAVESMDFQVRISVDFAGAQSPAVFHHDLSVPGSVGHFEADCVLGTYRQMSSLVSDGTAEAPPLPVVSSNVVQAKIRADMERETLVAAEEVLRLADRIGARILIGPLKKTRHPTYCINALRGRVRAFLVRGAKARGVVRDAVSREGDEEAGVSETLLLAFEVCRLASDQIEGSQFISSIAVLLTSTLQPSKALILAAKIIGTSLDRWTGRSAPSVQPFVPTQEEMRGRLDEIVRNPPSLFDETELAARVALELKRRDDVIEKRRSLVRAKSKGVVFERVIMEEDAPDTPPPERIVLAAAAASPSSPPSPVDRLDVEMDSPDVGLDMPGNPLMQKEFLPEQSPERTLEVLTASESSSPSAEDSYDSFQPLDYVEVSRARSEDALLRTTVAARFKALGGGGLVGAEASVCEMFALISNPFASRTVARMPPFKRSVQRVKTIFKLVHVAAAVAKLQIRAVGKVIFSSERATLACLSVLFRTLLPLGRSIEGDLQLQIMHETVRTAHFCDVMELLRMFFREPLLGFLSGARLNLSRPPVRPVQLLLDSLEHDGVHNLFLSLLGAELVLPRIVCFSDKIDMISILLGKLVVSDDSTSAQDRGAENASHVLKKIVSSLDHVDLNVNLALCHRVLFRQTFGPCQDPVDPVFSTWGEWQFRYSIRVLADFVLMTLGKFRSVEERLYNECVATAMEFLPVVKELLVRSFPPSTAKSVGFVRLELVNYLAALINARCARIDDALLSLDVMSSVLDVFFGAENSNLLHSYVTEFILIPICEDASNKLLHGAIHKGKLLERIMHEYVNVADLEASVPPKQINGFLTMVALAVSKSGAAEGHPGWGSFVLTKLLPVMRLQSRVRIVSEGAVERKDLVVD